MNSSWTVTNTMPNQSACLPSPMDQPIAQRLENYPPPSFQPTAPFPATGPLPRYDTEPIVSTQSFQRHASFDSIWTVSDDELHTTFTSTLSSTWSKTGYGIHPEPRQPSGPTHPHSSDYNHLSSEPYFYSNGPTMNHQPIPLRRHLTVHHPCHVHDPVSLHPNQQLKPNHHAGRPTWKRTTSHVLLDEDRLAAEEEAAAARRNNTEGGMATEQVRAPPPRRIITEHDIDVLHYLASGGKLGRLHYQDEVQASSPPSSNSTTASSTFSQSMDNDAWQTPEAWSHWIMAQEMAASQKVVGRAFHHLMAHAQATTTAHEIPSTSIPPKAQTEDEHHSSLKMSQGMPKHARQLPSTGRRHHWTRNQSSQNTSDMDVSSQAMKPNRMTRSTPTPA